MTDAESFLRTQAFGLLHALTPESAPHWGRMSAQQMLEHLESAMRMSTGDYVLPVVTPDEHLARTRAFLATEEPMPQGVVLPGGEGLVPPVHASLAAAHAELARATERFLSGERAGGVTPAHPVFGVLEHADWLRFHVKHVTHHLRQFGLID